MISSVATLPNKFQPKYCDSVWKSVILALENPGNLREFVLPYFVATLCCNPSQKQLLVLFLRELLLVLQYCMLPAEFHTLFRMA
jgi:hypothetical protein